MRQHRPIRRQDIKKLSIVRNPGTGPLLERLREKSMQGPIGFHPVRSSEVPDVAIDWWIKRYSRGSR